MIDNYSEDLVLRKRLPHEIIIKWAFIVLGVLAVISFFIIPSAFFLLAEVIGIWAIAIFMISRSVVEFEYIFVAGELEIDRIIGRRKRKKIMKVDVKNILMMAPEDSKRLDEALEENKKYKYYDFSTRAKDTKKYCIVTSKDGKECIIIFEPSDKTVELMKSYGPRLVFSN